MVIIILHGGRDSSKNLYWGFGFIGRQLSEVCEQQTRQILIKQLGLPKIL